MPADWPYSQSTWEHMTTWDSDDRDALSALLADRLPDVHTDAQVVHDAQALLRTMRVARERANRNRLIAAGMSEDDSIRAVRAIDLVERAQSILAS